MSFLQTVQDQVAESIRTRGHQLFSQHKVKGLDGDDYFAWAEVRDSYVCEVGAYRDDPGLAVQCTCSSFLASSEVCEHIWALLVAAAAKGYLQGDGVDGELYLEAD